jgi:ABC-type branched-subunit amino acid transport system ATPase component
MAGNDEYCGFSIRYLAALQQDSSFVEFLFEGNSIKVIAPHKIVEMGISQVPEGRKIFPNVSKIFKTIKEVNREGVTVLLVEQNARAALKLSNRGYVLENGRVAMQGKGEELLNNEDVRKAYLGE